MGLTIPQPSRKGDCSGRINLPDHSESDSQRSSDSLIWNFKPGSVSPGCSCDSRHFRIHVSKLVLSHGDRIEFFGEGSQLTAMAFSRPSAFRIPRGSCIP